MMKRKGRSRTAILLAHPFELLVALWALITGVPLAAGLIKPSSTFLQLDRPLLMAFGVMLSLGGALVLVGLYQFFMSRSISRLVLSLRVEQIGWVSVGSTVTVVGFLILASPTVSVVSLLVYWLIACACAARYIALSRVAKTYRRSLGDASDSH